MLHWNLLNQDKSNLIYINCFYAMSYTKRITHNIEAIHDKNIHYSLGISFLNYSFFVPRELFPQN